MTCVYVQLRQEWTILNATLAEMNKDTKTVRTHIVTAVGQVGYLRRKNFIQTRAGAQCDCKRCWAAQENQLSHH